VQRWRALEVPAPACINAPASAGGAAQPALLFVIPHRKLQLNLAPFACYLFWTLPCLQDRREDAGYVKQRTSDALSDAQGAAKVGWWLGRGCWWGEGGCLR
jgi:hypothetical protein